MALLCRKPVYGLIFLMFFFLGGCQKIAKKPDRLKILHSFSKEKPFFQIWPILLAEFQSKYNEIQIKNTQPISMLEQIRQLHALQRLPNLVYADPYGAAAKYLNEQNLLQNLMLLIRQDPLSSLELSPLALSPQDFRGEITYFLPLTLKLKSVLFINNSILEQEGLPAPTNMAALKQSIAVLRQRGYEYPLVAHFSYLADILDNLLSLIVTQNIGLDFLPNAAQRPEQYLSPLFRSALEQYISHLQEDGVLPPGVRSLGAGTSVAMFNNGQSAFLLAEPDVADFFTQYARSSAIWTALQTAQQPAQPGQIVPGRIEDGYAITRQTRQNPQLQSQALEFLYFVFTRGIELYQSNDTFNQIFSISSLSSTTSSKKQGFYLRTSHIAPSIQNIVGKQEYELFRRRSEQVANGDADTELLIKLFYETTQQHNLRHKSK